MFEAYIGTKQTYFNTGLERLGSLAASAAVVHRKAKQSIPYFVVTFRELHGGWAVRTNTFGRPCKNFDFQTCIPEIGHANVVSPEVLYLFIFGATF